jgi:putative sterol carrier protein
MEDELLNRSVACSMRAEEDMAEGASFDVEEITPEQFAQLVAGASDDQILEVVRAAGTERVLERIFRGMQERFVPERAQGVDAVVVFVITDQGEEHPFTVTIRDGTCAVAPGTDESPKVTITTDLLSFTKMTAGQVQGPALFMSGKLKLSGDLMFGARVAGFFDPPRAA